MPTGKGGVGEWASPRVVTPGRSTEPPGLQPPSPIRAGRLHQTELQQSPTPREGGCSPAEPARRASLPTRRDAHQPKGASVRRSDEQASPPTAPFRLNRLPAVPTWRITAPSPGPAFDGRQDNNNGVTAQYACPRRSDNVVAAHLGHRTHPPCRLPPAVPVIHRARPRCTDPTTRHRRSAW
jgi:hypothetical protein